MSCKWWRKWTGQTLRAKVLAAEEQHRCGVVRLKEVTDSVLSKTQLRRADQLLDEFSSEEKKRLKHD